RAVPAGSTLAIDDLPWGVRTAAAVARRIRRAALRAEGGGEILALALAAAIVLGFRNRLSRRPAAERIFPLAAIPVAFLATATATIVAVTDSPLWRRGAPSAAILLLAGALGLADRAWIRWRRARYLGPYRLLETLGEGGMGVVYRARHVVTRQPVALKAVHPRITAEEDARLRFLREAAILTRFDHPNIVRVFETGEISGRGFLCMEILDGRTLGALAREHGPLPPASAAAAIAVAAEALAEVHRHGIVHRDVKPENLFVAGGEPALPADLGGWRRRLKLMDFGLAQSVAREPSTAALLGTLPYVAPERLRGQAPDPRSDLYALGVVGFELATGRLPGTDLRDVEASCPALADLVARLLARDPAARPASAAEVAGIASEIAAGRTALPAPRIPAPAGPVRSAASSTARVWQASLAEIRRCLAEGRTTEAQVLLVGLLASLRRLLQSLPPEERRETAARFFVHDVIELQRELLPGAPCDIRAIRARRRLR